MHQYRIQRGAKGASAPLLKKLCPGSATGMHHSLVKDKLLYFFIYYKIILTTLPVVKFDNLWYNHGLRITVYDQNYQFNYNQVDNSMIFNF